MTIRAITGHLAAQLQGVQPSTDGEMRYFPCRVRLRDGQMIDRVYVQPLEPYRTYWGVLPHDDPGKRAIAIEEIVDLEESPSRLPPGFADELYRAGESGMGYTVFRVEFRNGASLAIMAGNAVDFIPYPPGLSPADIIAIRPHAGRDDSPQSSPPYYWAIFDGVEAPT